MGGRAFWLWSFSGRACRPDSRELIEHCRKSVAGYKKPRWVEFVDSLPKTPLQKVQKNVLRQQYKDWIEQKE